MSITTEQQKARTNGQQEKDRQRHAAAKGTIDAVQKDREGKAATRQEVILSFVKLAKGNDPVALRTRWEQVVESMLVGLYPHARVQQIAAEAGPALRGAFRSRFAKKPNPWRKMDLEVVDLIVAAYEATVVKHLPEPSGAGGELL